MPTTQAPFLSLIIPAYNEAQRLPATLQQAHAFLSAQTFTSEIIVVENGSTDGTYELVEGMKKTISQPQSDARAHPRQGLGGAPGHAGRQRASTASSATRTFRCPSKR